MREHWLGFVAERFPALLPRYERAYLGSTIRPDYLAAMERRVAVVRARYGVGADAVADPPWKQDRQPHPEPMAKPAGEQMLLPR